MESGELPRNALIRELTEELAISIEGRDVRPAGFAESGKAEGQSRIVLLLYTVETWSGFPIAQDENAEIGWFTPEQIGTLPRPPLDVALCGMVLPPAKQLPC